MRVVEILLIIADTIAIRLCDANIVKAFEERKDYEKYIVAYDLDEEDIKQSFKDDWCPYDIIPVVKINDKDAEFENLADYREFIVTNNDKFVVVESRVEEFPYA